MFAVTQKNFWRYWLGGLMLFSTTVIVSAQLGIAGVPGGILDHQSAGNAARVDEIHAAWHASELIPTAKLAMVLDLVFIGTYGFGAFVGGILFRRFEVKQMRRLGGLIAAAAIIFLIADYGETISQLIQLLDGAGDDQLAGLAALLQPIKMIAFLITFLGILAGLFVQRYFRSGNGQK